VEIAIVASLVIGWLIRFISHWECSSYTLGTALYRLVSLDWHGAGQIVIGPITLRHN
jgi:hypothetical protein